jgi:hypothetical protein
MSSAGDPRLPNFPAHREDFHEVFFCDVEGEGRDMHRHRLPMEKKHPSQKIAFFDDRQNRSPTSFRVSPRMRCQ